MEEEQEGEEEDEVGQGSKISFGLTILAAEPGDLPSVRTLFEPKEVDEFGTTSMVSSSPVRERRMASDEGAMALNGALAVHASEGALTLSIASTDIPMEKAARGLRSGVLARGSHMVVVGTLRSGVRCHT